VKVTHSLELADQRLRFQFPPPAALLAPQAYFWVPLKLRITTDAWSPWLLVK